MIRNIMKIFLRPASMAAVWLFAVVVPLQAVSSQQPWTWRAPLPQGETLQAAAHSPQLGKTVAVGDNGVILTLSGNQVETVAKIPNTYGFQDVTWTGTIFLAMARNSSLKAFRSSDGVAWSESPEPNLPYHGSASYLESAGNRTVALSWDAKAWVSTDANRLIWTPSSLPATPLSGGYKGSYHALAASSNLFVAVGTGGAIATSSDGITWTKRTSGTTVDLLSVASNGSGFVAVGNSWNSTTQETQYAILKSSDGITWSSGAFPSDADGNSTVFYNVFANGTGYISNGSEYFISPDGQSWTSVGSPDFSASGVSRSDDTRATAPSPSGSETLMFGHGGLIASFDGTNFRIVVADYIGGYLSKDSFAAAGLGGLFLAVDTNGSSRLIQSTDDVTFSTASSTTSAVARVGDTLVKFAEGTFESSTNGNSTWSTLGNGTFEGTVSSFAAKPQGPVAVVTFAFEPDPITGEYKNVFRLYGSTDWTNWTPVTTVPGFSVGYESQGCATPRVQWDGARFVLLSPNGRLSTSIDGLTWTVLPALPSDSAAYVSSNYGSGSPAANLVSAFASNGTTIVSRSGKLSNGYFSTSGPDRFFTFLNGSWRSSQPGRSGWTYNNGVVWTGSIFASSNSGEELNTSPDGVNWTRRELGTSVSELVWTGSQLVGITDKFGILTHPDGLSPLPPGPFTIVTPTIVTASSAGQVLPIAVVSNQDWKVVESLAWVTASPLTGTGNGTVQLTVAPNTTVSARTGNVTIGGNFLTLTQPGFITISSPSKIVGASTGLSYTVNATATMPWKITNPAPWISVAASSLSNGTVPTGNTTITLVAQPNPLPTTRTAVVSFGGLPHRVTQEAAPRNLPGGVSTFTVPVADLARSGWTAASDGSWPALSKTSGVGAGSVVVNIPENPTTQPRTVTLTINGLNYVLNQQGQTLPLLHRGTYTGILHAASPPAGNSSIFYDVRIPLGGISVTLTPSTLNTVAFTGSVRTDGLTYTGRGLVNTSTVPWKISGNWTAPTKPVSAISVELEFEVNSPFTKLMKGTADGWQVVAGKQVFDGRSSLFPDAGTYVSLMGDRWPAATAISISTAGVATFAGKFVDGIPLTMSVPVIGATGIDKEWGLAFFTSTIYSAKGTLVGAYAQRPDLATPGTFLASGIMTSWVPARPELPATDASGKLSGDYNVDFLLNRYVRPATGQPAFVWPSGNATASFGVIDIPDISPYPDTIYGRVRLLNRTNALAWSLTDEYGNPAPNTNKLAFTFNSANGLLEGSFTIPVSHPDDNGISLGTRIVRFYGIANQDYDGLRANDGFEARFLSPTIKVKSLLDPLQMSESTGAVGEFLITPEGGTTFRSNTSGGTLSLGNIGSYSGNTTIFSGTLSSPSPIPPNLNLGLAP